MRVIVACEFSGVVRDAFLRAGHDAVSCDLLPSESSYGPHIQGDIRDVDLSHYDLMIAHPPCTYLCASGARWFASRRDDQRRALAFIQWLMDAPVEKIAIENPVGVISTRIRKPDQYIQPWEYGHGEMKKTGLWLRGLPHLHPTCIVSGREERVHKAPQTRERWKERSRFYPGIAQAMVEQWAS